MHNRRARPTLRVLSECLTSDWEDPAPSRALADEDWAALHPLSELPHPLVRKCRERFGSDPAHDGRREPIECARALGLLEVRAGHWRGGVWTDPETGVRWLCTAGLAKGNHEDHDDFYQELGALMATRSEERLLPTAQDRQLLKRETAAARLTTWELALQTAVAMGLQEANKSGHVTVPITHPVRSEDMGSAVIELASEPGHGYDVDVCTVVVDLNKSYRSSSLGWQATLRVLISLSPPAQGWDRVGDTFSVIEEPGGFERRAEQLRELAARAELAAQEPGAVSHYTHSRHIADNAVNGRGTRALCGVFFVPFQDHQDKPECPECARVWESLPA